MPILHRGIEICGQCKREFPWIHYEPPRARANDLSILPEEIPEGQIIAHSWDDDGVIYHAAANCPFCDYDNSFSGTLVKNENMV